MRVVSAIQPHLVPFSSRVRAFPRGRASRASETRARWDARVPDSDRQQNAPRLPPSARDARARDPSFSLSFSLTAIPNPSPSAARHLRGLPALEQITSRVQVLEWGIWALQGERQHANPCMHAYMHACIYAYMHTCMHACISACMHAWMYTCMHVNKRARLHTHTCTCMHARTHAQAGFDMSHLVGFLNTSDMFSAFKVCCSRERARARE